MTIDAIDAAFIGRWEKGLMPQRATRSPTDSSPRSPAAHKPDPAPADDVPEPLPCGEQPLPEPRCPDGGSVLDRLLHAAWPQWNRLAETVEEARSRGRRVIAITGGEPREGRSTLVAGLARVLRARGRDVVEAGPEAGGGASEPTHDKRIVLVDAGIWFPPGPIRRQRLVVASLGCEAAILVRRADRQAAPAREAVLESLGIEVLGEVVSFSPAAPPTATA